MNKELCQQLFNYQNGSLYWKINKGTAKAGDKAHSNGNGYLALKVNNIPYLEHRLIWLWHNGELSAHIDHINGIRNDNRIENLRIATHSENMRNAKIRKDSKSGIKGVHWCKTKQKWKATLTFNGKQHYLGRFDDLDLAKKAVDEARKIHHGKFYNSGA